MNVPIFRPECVCHTECLKKFRQRLDSLISRGAFIRGEEVHELENTLTNYLETYSVLTTANGTDALMASLDGPRFGSRGMKLSRRHLVFLQRLK